MMESHIGPSTGAARGMSSSSSELTVKAFPQRPRVAIPRLPLSGDDGSGSPAGGGDKHRVSHACEPCRQRKTKVRAKTLPRPEFFPCYPSGMILVLMICLQRSYALANSAAVKGAGNLSSPTKLQNRSPFLCGSLSTSREKKIKKKKRKSLVFMA